MPSLKRIKRYLATLTIGRLILWFYLIWYLVVVIRYFDASPTLWLTAIGLSAIIGSALWLNTAGSGSKPVKLETWPIVRLFLFPFCVSSFSALVKEHHFFLIFSPNGIEMGVAIGLCAALGIVVMILKHAENG